MPTKTARKIVKIDEDKCDGCGVCVPSCAEGAIQIIAGKARLVSEIYCDGLGACLGECPMGAITIEERVAEAFDEKATEQHLAKQESEPEPVAFGCPSARVTQFEREVPRSPVPNPQPPSPKSALAHWPVQLTLVPPQAPFLQGTDLLLAADCAPFAYPNFHNDFLKNHSLLIACPKLDNLQAHIKKLTDILRQSTVKSLAVLHISLLVLLVMVAGCSRSAAAPMATEPAITPTARLWTFNTNLVGGLPQGAAVFGGNWSVRAESGTTSAPNALCQVGTATYPAMTLSDTVYTDVLVQTRFKPISGNTDRAAGIIFRVQDKNNYYIIRANALEDNVNIYKYASGVRSLLKNGSAKVLSGQWQELRVEVVGSRIRGFLNGRLVVETSDGTFKSGKVGLWTKADSVTCFDDVDVRAP